MYIQRKVEHRRSDEVVSMAQEHYLLSSCVWRSEW